MSHVLVHQHLQAAADSRTYCDDISGTLREHGLQLTELSTHLQGQLVAAHSAYDLLLDAFAPPQVRRSPERREAWAVEQLLLAAKASRNLGLNAHVTFSGALAWPFLYPFPQRPVGLIEEAFRELARRWRPILAAFDEAGSDLCFELHPSEDLHDGVTFERFLAPVDYHPRANMLYDPGDGQIDFKAIFSRLAQYGFAGWAVLEWECCLKHAFGPGTFQRPWLQNAMDAEAAAYKMDVAFEFFAKLGTPFYCFHDVDVMAAARK